MSLPLHQRIKHELRAYRLLLAHPRTPRRTRWLLGAALAYLVSPIDLIPDAIPLLGQLDDVLIVPGLVWFAMRGLPRGLWAECRAAARQSRANQHPTAP